MKPTTAGEPVRHRAFASCLVQVGPLARDVRDAGALLYAVSVASSATRPRPGAVPRDLIDLPADDVERRLLRGKRPAAEGVLRGGHGARRRGPCPRGRRGARGAGASVEEGSLPHTDYGLATYYIVAPPRPRQPRRYDGVRFGYGVRGATTISRTTRHARPGLRRGGQAPRVARHNTRCRPATTTRSRQAQKTADADQARLRPAVGGGLRRARRAHSPSVRVPIRGPDAIPSRCTCPTPARCR